MNSPFATLFLALQQHIHDSMPAIRHIDQNLGQLSIAGRPPVSWPCALIDFDDFSFSDLAANVQLANGAVVISLGFAPYSASSQASPLPVVQQALAYYDLEWALHKVLQGWSPGSDFGSLNRISAVTLNRTDGYRVRELRYAVAFHDYSAMPQQSFAPVTLAVTGQMLL